MHLARPVRGMWTRLGQAMVAMNETLKSFASKLEEKYFMVGIYQQGGVEANARVLQDDGNGLMLYETREVQLMTEDFEPQVQRCSLRQSV